MAAPRCDAHLLRLEFADGIHTHFPGERALCLTGEIYTGFDRAANGDIYVAGLPSFRLNIERLELDAMPGPLVVEREAFRVRSAFDEPAFVA